MSDITQAIIRYRDPVENPFYCPSFIDKHSDSFNTIFGSGDFSRFSKKNLNDYHWYGGKGGIITSCLESFNLKVIPKKIIESLIGKEHYSDEVGRKFSEEKLFGEEYIEMVQERSIGEEFVGDKRSSVLDVKCAISSRITYICCFRNKIFIFYTCDMS
jgi:hypothetical protein